LIARRCWSLRDGFVMHWTTEACLNPGNASTCVD
jgi:hypothetical protein